MAKYLLKGLILICLSMSLIFKLSYFNPSDGNSYSMSNIIFSNKSWNMRHIILEFAETPTQENIDISIIEYDYSLSLNVFKGTKIPAVNFSDQATETFTKAHGEGTDSDMDMKNSLCSILDTSTQTRMNNEISDVDGMHHFSRMLDTSTQTLVHNEVSDSDKNFRDLEFLSATRTLTESSEVLDNDK